MMNRCLFLLATCTFLTAHAVAGERPNILFICIDDLRPNLGCYGDEIAITPHIDRLAGRALLFDRAYCQQALCAPSRASLMTGLRPDTLHIRSESVHFRDVLPDVVTLPQLLKQYGYHTQAFGKVYHAYPPQPDDISWTVPERLLDIPKRDEYLLPENRVRGFINPMEKGTAVEAIVAPDDAYQDGQVAIAAIETLDTIKDKGPFFLAVGFKRPHLPFTAPKKYWGLYNRNLIPLPADRAYPKDELSKKALSYDWADARGEMRGYTDIPKTGSVSDEKARELIHGYYACISYVDAQIGRVINALDSLGLREKTIVILWSDNGYHLGERELWGKKDNSEDATRVVLMLDVPGMKNRGTKTRALVELVDIYPTLIELCGVPIPAVLQGTSMVPLLSNPGQPWKAAAFSSYPRENYSIMTYAVRTRNYRYHAYFDTADGELVNEEIYNMGNDPLQRHNLIGERSLANEIANHRRLLQQGWKAARPRKLKKQG